MYVKVPIEYSGSSALPLFFEVLARHDDMSADMDVEFLVYWRCDPDRDDVLTGWISEHRGKYKRISINYFTHSQLLDDAMFANNVDHHYEVDITTMSMLQVAHR